jgi:hypothetical protein
MRHSIESLCGLPEQDSWGTRAPPRFEVHAPLGAIGQAEKAAHAAIEAAARRTAAFMIKWRARHFMLIPADLDDISKGLSFLPPKAMLAELRYLSEILPPHRWFGFGGEVPAINLHAANLYARLLRAKAAQLANRGRAA